jgi:hypothetical protein
LFTVRKKNNYIYSSPKELLENIYFVKDYAWSYENEFRILITIHKDVFDKYNRPKRIAVKVPLEVVNQFRYRTGPEFESSSLKEDRKFFDYIKKENENYKKNDKIKYFLKSKLGIKMRLIEKNRKEIETYLKTLK